MKCTKCEEFLSKYSCNSPDECDCPKCQGLCDCFELEEVVSKHAFTHKEALSLADFLAVVLKEDINNLSVEGRVVRALVKKEEADSVYSQCRAYVGGLHLALSLDCMAESYAKSLREKKFIVSGCISD